MAKWNYHIQFRLGLHWLPPFWANEENAGWEEIRIWCGSPSSHSTDSIFLCIGHLETRSQMLNVWMNFDSMLKNERMMWTYKHLNLLIFVTTSNMFNNQLVKKYHWDKNCTDWLGSKRGDRQTTKVGQLHKHLTYVIEKSDNKGWPTKNIFQRGWKLTDSSSIILLCDRLEAWWQLFKHEVTVDGWQNNEIDGTFWRKYCTVYLRTQTMDTDLWK